MFVERRDAQVQLLTEDAASSARSGNTTAAIGDLTRVIQMQPNNYYALNNLALILASAPDPSLRNGKQALALAQQAAKIDDNHHVESYDTLAAAEAENGDFADAIIHERQAIDLAQTGNATSNQAALLDALNKRLQGYEKNQPYRQ